MPYFSCISPLGEFFLQKEKPTAICPAAKGSPAKPVVELLVDGVSCWVCSVPFPGGAGGEGASQAAFVPFLPTFNIPRASSQHYPGTGALLAQGSPSKYHHFDFNKIKPRGECSFSWFSWWIWVSALPAGSVAYFVLLSVCSLSPCLPLNLCWADGAGILKLGLEISTALLEDHSSFGSLKTLKPQMFCCIPRIPALHFWNWDCRRESWGLLSCPVVCGYVGVPEQQECGCTKSVFLSIFTFCGCWYF